MALTIVGLGLLFFLGHALNWFFAKTKIPDLLILVALGFLIGPVLGILSGDDFGRVGPVLSTLALIVILYEGGLHLSARDLLTSSLPAAGLSFFGFLLSILIAFIVVYLGGSVLVFFGMEPQPLSVALLIGVGIGSTSSAVVIPMVKHLSISKNTKTVLSLESAFTDVLTIVCFLVLVDSFTSGDFKSSDIFIGLGPNTFIAVVLGFIMAIFWAFINSKYENMMPEAFAGEAWALLTYGVLELAGYNGAIGVLALGFTLANLNLMPQRMQNKVNLQTLRLYDLSLLKEITFLLRTVFFLYLGILIQLNDWRITLLALIMCLLIFLKRYAIVHILFKAKSYSRLDAMVSTAMGPRGLACAVLATLPLQRGIEGGEFIQKLMFAIIPFSILLTSIFGALSEQERFRQKLSKLFQHYPEDSPPTAG
jgi:cell volume regulation protein A